MIWLTRDFYLTLDGYDRMQIIESQFFNRILYYNYAIVAHIVAYGVVILLEIKHLRHKLSTVDKTYVFGVCSIYLLSMVMHAFFVEFAGSWRDFTPYYLTISVYFLLVGYLLYTNPKFLTSIGGKYFSSNLGEEEMKAIVAKMDALFKSEGVFLQRNLSLSQVAEKLNIPSYKISQSLSTHLAENFNDYVNKHRIKHAENLLKSSDFQHYKIEAIAIDSGFNNKVTFYKAFTAIHQMTPSAFRKAHIYERVK
ncbi:helix-turn-helix domain-containing protein [Ekhidna sp.]|uniref:helix-turn-helix domain-containing protein n=1 Tax=Ekhidna sp. TaxID=2608089 RepID=UPI0035160422